MKEALELDVGFLHYLYVKALKEIKLKNDQENKNNKYAEVFDDIATKLKDN